MEAAQGAQEGAQAALDDTPEADGGELEGAQAAADEAEEPDSGELDAAQGALGGAHGARLRYTKTGPDNKTQV